MPEATHLVDYYPQRGLRLDPADYQIGAGTGVWTETNFADASLEICDDDMHAAALFTDADGRRVEGELTTVGDGVRCRTDRMRWS